MARASDRQILSLALPALPALAAEPLYVLVDTAVVGHLGAAELGGLAIGALLLTDAAWLCNFLIYGTTAMSARLYGAGRRQDAVRQGVQATWLAVAIGLVVIAVLQLIAQPAADLIGDDPVQIASAVSWLRIASCGAPFILISFAGQGWMRGVQDVRRPLVYLLGAMALSAVLCPLLVFPLGLGLEGSAIANVVSQALAAALFLRALHREHVGWGRDWPVIRAQLATARDLGVRTAAFSATYLAAAAVASRMGTSHVAAHQIALQLWTFLALVMDSVAIAAQSLIGELLGRGDRDDARSTARRLAEIGTVLGVVFAVLLAAGWNVIPALFTRRGGGARPGTRRVAVVHRDAAAVRAPVRARRHPDRRRRHRLHAQRHAARRARRLPAADARRRPYFDWGLGGIWAGLLSFIVIRTVGCVAPDAGRPLGGRRRPSVQRHRLGLRPVRLAHRQGEAEDAALLRRDEQGLAVGAAPGDVVAMPGTAISPIRMPAGSVTMTFFEAQVVPQTSPCSSTPIPSQISSNGTCSAPMASSPETGYDTRPRLPLTYSVFSSGENAIPFGCTSWSETSVTALVAGSNRKTPVKPISGSVVCSKSGSVNQIVPSRFTNRSFGELKRLPW